MKWTSGLSSNMKSIGVPISAWKLTHLSLQQERAKQTENQQLHLDSTKNLVCRQKATPKSGETSESKESNQDLFTWSRSF